MKSQDNYGANIFESGMPKFTNPIVNPFQRVASRLCRTAKKLKSWSDRCWEYALEAIMYDVISNVFIKIIKLSLFEHLICIIEYVI